MNQILYTNNTKRSQPLQIKTIARIFAIVILIFGVILVGQGSFAMIKGSNEEQTTSAPVVILKQEGNIVKVNITHNKAIDKIVYSFSENEQNVLQGKGRTQIEEQITLKKGVTTLTLKVSDIEGKTITCKETYEVSNSDVTKPEIELLVENAKVKIVAKDETALDYIIYYWNNEDETKIEAREESPKQIEDKIAILKGTNTLTIVAVDKAGNETTKEQTYVGAKKPTIELARDGQELIVKVKDEEGVKKIEYTLNGVYYSTDKNNTGASLNMKEVEFRQKLSTGENSITIKAYNINGLTEELSGKTTI